jgi:hypothetical protein
VQDPALQFANPYLAMSNNPVSFVDPDGRLSKGYRHKDPSRFVEMNAQLGHISGGGGGLIPAGAQTNALNNMLNWASNNGEGEEWDNENSNGAIENGQMADDANDASYSANNNTRAGGSGGASSGTINSTMVDGVSYLINLPEVEIAANGKTSYDIHAAVQNSLDNLDGGNGFDNFIDNLELSSDLWGPVSNGADNILRDRGKYLPRREIYGGNRNISIITPLTNINVGARTLNLARVGGKLLGAANVLATGYEIGSDVMDGKYKSAGARTAVYGVAAGAACIPVVGWGVALGIGVADYVWGDEFYEWVEN